MYLSTSVENNHSRVSASGMWWDALGRDHWSRFVGQRLAREDKGGEGTPPYICSDVPRFHFKSQPLVKGPLNLCSRVSQGENMPIADGCRGMEGDVVRTLTKRSTKLQKCSKRQATAMCGDGCLNDCRCKGSRPSSIVPFKNRCKEG